MAYAMPIVQDIHLAVQMGIIVDITMAIIADIIVGKENKNIVIAYNSI